MVCHPVAMVIISMRFKRNTHTQKPSLILHLQRVSFIVRLIIAAVTKYVGRCRFSMQ